ncbi:MAG: RNA polymerase sigma-70 factor (ECF subfamily) [Rickettsiales bacterium]|jgi:RNA polymerase sigma-70 factor (ECF subfamily)
MDIKNKILMDLMIAGIAGDKSAYTEFLTKITLKLRFSVARKITSADVEDVIQEILISIHKARHTYDGQRPIMPWIMAIANFRITDYLRKHYSQMRHKTTNIADLENILADVTNDDVSDEYKGELLVDADGKNKRILTMLHIEGYTAKEVAAKIGMGESAVKVAAHRAIKKIRIKLGFHKT